MDTGTTSLVYEFGEFHVDAVRRVLRSRTDARPIDLPPRAFDTLLYLVEHAGDLVEKHVLMDAVWSNVVVEEGNLTQTIYLLRRALGEHPDEHQFIVTVPKHGYKFVGHVRNVGVRAPGGVEAAAAPITMPPPAVDNARRGFARRAGAWAAVVPVLLLGGGAFWYHQRASEAAKDATPTANTAQPAASPAVSDARPSIAVLPFDNRSHEADDAFFVDGIHDDILTQLSKVSALKVISRTSVEQFRDTKLPTKAIADQLGVTRILEGDVQRAGDRVRIHVQLIDAGSDTHLWAESYDRQLTAANIFAIQSEVAAAIARALQATLTPNERRHMSEIPTQDLASWEAYQIGRQRMARRTTGALADAARFFQRSIDRDPNFALAYTGLADTLLLQEQYGGIDYDAAIARASRLVTQTVALDPSLAEAAVSSGMLAWTLHDYSKAEVEFRRAIDLNPNSAEAHQWYSGVLLEVGRIDEALVHAQRAARLDPLSAIVRFHLGATLTDLGRYAEAIQELNKALEIDPSHPNPYAMIGEIRGYAFGRLDEAVAWSLRAAELDPANAGAAARLTRMYFDLGDDAAALQCLTQSERLDTGEELTRFMAAIAALYRGQPNLAIEHANRAMKVVSTAPEMMAAALAVLRNADLQAGNYDTARERYAHLFPELFASPSPKVDLSNYRAAIDLALVLQRSGQTAAARRLLELSEVTIRNHIRLGVWGSGIADVQIQALRGEKRNALGTLRAVAQDGWRGPQWRYYRDHDPNLASIRNEPEFKAVFADIERDMAEQRAELAARPKDAPLDVAPAQ
ncbi:MAG TPA: tetratricopeptide repeat protein [Steroidobacteraceae bacterium]|jgi:TolB-like protein/DNA-binding winged helix-turn-helix (wHTH) protein/Tfp pilus assembly protein PilF|nr:tetratricopeptide repeat protein [Steroidobacteraceae bacterium]